MNNLNENTEYKKVTFWKLSQEKIKENGEIKPLEAFPQPSINAFFPFSLHSPFI